jgi:prolyl 4-hydroxylase
MMTMPRSSGAATLLLLLLAVSAAATAAVADGSDYGVDCSFPIHYNDETSWRCGTQLGDRKTEYEKFMQGCRDHHGPKRADSCDVTEEDRLKMSLLQPMSMVVRNRSGVGNIIASGPVSSHLTLFSTLSLILLLSDRTTRRRDSRRSAPPRA